MKRTKCCIAALVLALVGALFAGIALMLPERVHAEESEGNTLYDWNVQTAQSGIASQTEEGVKISLPGYLRAPLSAEGFTLGVDFSGFKTYDEGEGQSIVYWLLSPTPKKASYSYVNNGDGIYIQLRDYKDGDMRCAVEYVSEGKLTSVQKLADVSGASFGFGKSDFASFSLETRNGAQTLVFKSKQNAEKTVDISAIPTSCYIANGGTYFGTCAYGDKGVKDAQLAYTLKSVEGALTENVAPHTVFTETDYSAPAAGTGREKDWVAVSGNAAVTAADGGISLRGDTVTYDYSLNAEGVTIHTDLSKVGETLLDGSKEGLVYFGLTKDVSTSAGYTLPGEGVWLLLRNYLGKLSLSVYKNNQLQLTGQLAESNGYYGLGLSGMKIGDVKTISFVKSGEGYALYINSTKVAVQFLDTYTADSFSVEGKTRLTVCTYFTTAQPSELIVKDVVSEGKVFLGEEEPAPHVCESKCPTCGKCTNADCQEEACKDKCGGHEEPAPHVCESKCPTCGKCTNETCQEEACKDKCGGHEVPKPQSEYFEDTGESFPVPETVLKEGDIIPSPTFNGDNVTYDAQGAKIVGAGFYNYRLDASKPIIVHTALEGFLESVKEGNGWKQECCVYLAFLKAPAAAHYSYEQPGMYIMLRNVGGELLVMIQIRPSSGGKLIDVLVGADDKKDCGLSFDELSTLALRPIEGKDTGFELLFNGKKLVNTPLSDLDRSLIANEEGNTYFGVMTFSAPNADPAAERTLRIREIENEGKQPLGSTSDAYYYPSGETITPPATVLADEDWHLMSYSPDDSKSADGNGVTFTGGGYYLNKLKMNAAGDRTTVFLDLIGLAESLRTGSDWTQQGLAYLCLSPVPTAAHFTYPEAGIYLMFRNIGGTLHFQVDYKGPQGSGSVFSDTSAMGDTGLAISELSSVTFLRTASGYEVMINDLKIRCDFSKIPGGICEDKEGFAYLGGYTWASPDNDPARMRTIRIRAVENEGKQPFEPQSGNSFFVETGEMLPTPATKTKLDDFILDNVSFYDVAEETDGGVRLTKPGYYNYALVPDDITVFLTLDSVQPTNGSRTQQGLVYLYFGSRKTPASYTYDAPGLYVMLRNVGGKIVIQVSYRTPANNTTVISESDVAAMSPVTVEELRYIRLVRAEEGFELWLNNFRVNNEELTYIPHDIIENADGKTFFGFMTWASPDHQPDAERLITICEVVNEGKTKLSSSSTEPSTPNTPDTPGKPSDTEDPSSKEEKEEGGCGGVLSVSALLMGIAAGVFLLKKKRR